MAIWKQGAIFLALATIALVAWLRIDPAAPARLAAIGIPETYSRLVAGGTEQDSGTARANNRRFQRPGSNTLVVVSEVGSAPLNDRISAIGDGEASRSVTVVPLSSGILREVRVQAGEKVSAGEVLAVLDSDTQRIARDQAALTVQINRDRVDRYERLLESRAASQVQLTEARNELENARLSLREAEVALERRSITAPIAGIVGIVPVEAGDYVTQQSDIATIDDRSSLLVDFWVPERFAGIVQSGKEIEAGSIAVPGRTFLGEIVAIASRVDRDSRTLQLRAKVDNSEDLLRPGMSFRVRTRFQGESYPAVDPLAVQWSSAGPFVWLAKDEKAQKVSIQVIQRNSDYVLVQGDVAPGDLVITEGLQSLRPGMPLDIARQTTAPTQPGS